MELKFSEQFWATNSSSNQPNQITYDKRWIKTAQLSLSLIKHHTMKAYMVVKYGSLHSLPWY